MREQPMAEALRKWAEEEVPDTLNLWPGIQAQLANRQPGTRFPLSNLAWRGRLAGAGVLVALMVAVFLVSTPARAWAQEVLRRFGVVFLVGAKPEWVEGSISHEVAHFTGEAEAREWAGFPLRWPQRFPFDRAQATFSGFVVRAEEGSWLNGLYADAQRRYLEFQVFWRKRPGPWPVGNARLEAIVVSDREGLWAEGVPRSFIAGTIASLTSVKPNDIKAETATSPASLSTEEVNVLLWEDGKVLYVLIDPERRFSQADLLQVAESLY